MRVSLVVDFDPITADMAPGTIWHPYHAFSALCNVTCLGCWLELEIQLSRLIRRSEEHTSELQSQSNLVCRLLLEKKKIPTTFVSRLCLSLSLSSQFD